MRFVDEYRSNEKVQTLLEAIRKKVTRPWYIMEICGGQTHAIARYRLEEMLPPDLQLLHGPGCPVCVTPVETIDYALKLATQPNVILASFGDMMRVPGSKEDLLSVKARGADIRMLYTPLDALSLAKENPDKDYHGITGKSGGHGGKEPDARRFSGIYSDHRIYRRYFGTV